MSSIGTHLRLRSDGLEVVRHNNKLDEEKVFGLGYHRVVVLVGHKRRAARCGVERSVIMRGGLDVDESVEKVRTLDMTLRVEVAETLPNDGRACEQESPNNVRGCFVTSPDRTATQIRGTAQC